MKNTDDILTVEDVFCMLDSFFDNPGTHWDQFYSDARERNIPIPFLVEAPDENLVKFTDQLYL